MGVEIKGLDSLARKTRQIPSIISKAVLGATIEVTENVKTAALDNLDRSIKHNSGALRGSIKDETVVNADGRVIGRVWSDKANAFYREFGTGPVGQASPKDLPEGITPVYTQKPWFFPVDSVDVDLEALYGMKKISFKDGDSTVEFYMTSGQPAKPWLYPALRTGTEKSDIIYRKHVQQELRKGLK